jgi:hypothetical protein
MKIRYGSFDLFRLIIILLAGGFACGSTPTSSIKDGGADRGQPGVPDAGDSAALDLARTPDLAGPEVVDGVLAGPDAAVDLLLGLDRALDDLAPSDVVNPDRRGRDFGKDTVAGDLVDAAIESVRVLDGSSFEQGSWSAETNTLDGDGEAGGSATFDPFAGVALQPDTDTTPVVSCADQPDMTLCNVVTAPDRWYDICVGGKCVSPGCGDSSCNAPAPHFPIPANTNHAYLQRINSSGSQPVVADLVTGLQWQGCDAGRSDQGCTTGASQKMTWSDAISYCDGLSWGGKSDWYLPDSYELMSIVDWGKSGDTGVTIDPAVFPHSSYAYWTSHFARTATVFGIQFRFIDPVILSDYDAINSTLYVRCVRRGSSRNAAYVGTRFASAVVEYQKIITDPATGLTWQGCSSEHKGLYCDISVAGSLPRAEWVSHCESLDWGGFTDWRLPTYKELHSIAEYPPLVNPYRAQIDDTVFDLDVSYGMGTRSGWQDDASLFLFDFDDSGFGFLDLMPTAGFPVICVRGS